MLPTLPDKSVDLVLTDPPYGLAGPPSLITRNGGKFGRAKAINRGLVENPSVATGVDYRIWIPMVVPKLKPVGVLITFCGKADISSVSSLLEELGMTVRHIGAWVKANPAPQARKVKWMNAWEPFIIATVNKGSGHHYDYRQGQHGDVVMTPICQGRERFDHPTQKPLALAYPLVRWWSYKGDTVLDPFCGTGTFLVAAADLGRNYVGIEINEGYCEIARRRLKEVAKVHHSLCRWTL
jgi:DNA modification methylase